jgi:putative chitinase
VTIDVTRLQQRLNAKGFAISVDDVAGPQTYGALFGYMANRDLGDRGRLLGQAAAEFFPQFGIDANGKRLAHFLGQASHETGAFRFMKEIWGPTTAQQGYEGRADLGNCIAGDGKKFLGRGIFQCTGRDNYERYGKRIGVDLTCEPEKAAEPRISLWIACLYWDDHKLNLYADADNVKGVSNGINRGNPASIKAPNGFSGRVQATARAKQVLL